jgi:hypothetical protein
MLAYKFKVCLYVENFSTNSSGAMVKHLPHHHKVKGSSLTTSVTPKREKMVEMFKNLSVCGNTFSFRCVEDSTLSVRTLLKYTSCSNLNAMYLWEYCQSVLILAMLKNQHCLSVGTLLERDYTDSI